MDRIKKLLLIVLFALCLFFVGCKDNTKKRYNVSFDLDGGVMDASLSQAFSLDDNFVLPTPTKEGYAFKGWFEVNDDGSLSYYEITKLIEHDYKLKAKWEKENKVDELEDMFTKVKRIKKDITFKLCDNYPVKMDIYLPAMKEGEKYPVLFFYFGGGWLFGDKSYITYYNIVLKDLADDGYIVVAPNYRLVGDNGETHYPSQVEDAFDAIRYVVKYQDELHADVDKMGSFGHSAGGYFSLMTALAQDHFKGDESLASYEFKLKFAIALSAPCFYTPDAVNNLSLKGRTMLFGYLHSSDLSNPEFAKAFPSYYVSENNPKIYLVHGTADELVPIEQSRAFYELALEQGIDVKMIEIEYANHTYGGTDGHSVSEAYSAGAKVLRQFIIDQK